MSNQKKRIGNWYNGMFPNVIISVTEFVVAAGE